jgi:hypothetical protein
MLYMIVVFKSVFYLEMHQNNIFFYFFKNIFYILEHQNYLKTPKKFNLK